MLVTVTGPVVAVAGTVGRSCVALTNVTALAATPLNFTLELLVNPTPLIVTTVPYGPLLGPIPVIESVGVNEDALVRFPAAVVTEIFPATAPCGTVAVICVAETTLNDAARLPNFTEVAPLKAVPVIVTALPVIPAADENALTAGGGEVTTVKVNACVASGLIPFAAFSVNE